MDETYIKVRGQWKYLYRAVDEQGNTVDFLLRAHRDKVAAQRYFEKSIDQNGEPETVTIDKSGANLAALTMIRSSALSRQSLSFAIRGLRTYARNRFDNLSFHSLAPCCASLLKPPIKLACHPRLIATPISRPKSRHKFTHRPIAVAMVFLSPLQSGGILSVTCHAVCRS
jgi:hypothetical protein